MGFFKRVSTISRRDNQDLDTDINTSIMAGLEDKKCLSEIKIMGALLNPLYQSKSRMIEGGLCTEHQYMAGKAELLDRLSHFYEGQEQESHLLSNGMTLNSLIVQRSTRLLPRKLKTNTIFIVFTCRAHIFQGWSHLS